MGPYHLMGFAKKCFKLELFLHLSTAYVNVPRTGRIMEEKLYLPNSMGRENLISKSPGRFLPALLLENEKKMVVDCKKTCADNVIAKKMKELGSQRAKEFGWPNAYTFAKAIGEMVIETMREDIEVVIIRPAGVEGTCKEPFPGWIEGNKSMDPFVLFYGEGKLTGFPSNADNVIDIVPVDMVVNVTLAAMVRHGLTRKAGINIYHVSSSILNPLIIQNMFGLFYEHFKSSPSIDENGKAINIQKLKIFSSMEDFNAHLLREATLNCSNMNPSQKAERRKFMEVAKYMAKVYEPFAFYHYRFSTSNTQRLLEIMSEEEKKRFGFDVTCIDWKHYIVNVHIPAYRRHVMKEKSSSKL
ncbi:hypothetical protein CRYUN_Cryun16bG0089500 [Craigia yunnanensis]